MYILCDELVCVRKSALGIDGLMDVLASYRLPSVDWLMDENISA